MKNKSFQYPFPTHNDNFFDKDKSGDLNTVETVFRDAHLNEMKQKTEIDDNPKISVASNNKEETAERNNGNIFAIIAVVISLILIVLKILFR
ncbi:MAG TPA: hypothetical protein GXZ23_06255 [Clostridiales bacterium]|nr:hypothetical protein [Clostridiales bacterium]